MRAKKASASDPSKNNVAATDAALIALGAGVPKFRDGFVDVLVDVRRVNDARIIELVQAFRKNGLQGVQVFESADQMPGAARYVWVKGLSYVEAYKTDSQREEPRRIKLPWQLDAGQAPLLPFSKITNVLVRLDHIATRIVNANHGIMWTAVMHRVLELPPQNGEVSKKKADADQSNTNTSRKLDAE
jgi:hypothetical protein